MDPCWLGARFNGYLMVPGPIDNCIKVSTGMFSVEVGVGFLAPCYPICRNEIGISMAHEELPEHFNAMI